MIIRLKMFGIKLSFVLAVLINFYHCAVINVTQLSTGLTLSFDQTKGLLVLVPTPSSTPNQSQPQNVLNGDRNSFMSLFRGAQNYYGQNPMLWNLQNIPKINPKNSSSGTAKDAPIDTTSNKTTLAQIPQNASEIGDKKEDTHLLDFNSTEQKKTVPSQNSQLGQNNDTEEKKNEEISPSNAVEVQMEPKGNASQIHDDQGLAEISVSVTGNESLGSEEEEEQVGNVSIAEDEGIEKEQNQTLQNENMRQVVLQENNDDGQEVHGEVSNQTITAQAAEAVTQGQPINELNHEASETADNQN